MVAFEALVGAQTAHVWLPMFEVWQIGLGLMAILTAVNLASARSYGEFEFWFASIKVAAIVVFIVVAAGWLLGVGNPSSPGVTNLSAHQGFTPFGWAAILTGVTTVIFSMVGAEIVTVAAAESAESNKTLSRLAATMVLRILLFYVLSIALILCIVPWTEFKSGDSTFALALERIGIPGAAAIMNIIVLTAVLSCLNSGVYVTARVLFAMADKGDAPRWLTTVNKRQVPARAILLGSAFGFIVMLMNWIAPEKLFNFLMNSSGALMMFTYLFVVLAHFRFPYSSPALRTRVARRSLPAFRRSRCSRCWWPCASCPASSPRCGRASPASAVIVVAVKRESAPWQDVGRPPSARRGNRAPRRDHRRIGYSCPSGRSGHSSLTWQRLPCVSPGDVAHFVAIEVALAGDEPEAAFERA